MNNPRGFPTNQQARLQENKQNFILREILTSGKRYLSIKSKVSNQLAAIYRMHLYAWSYWSLITSVYLTNNYSSKPLIPSSFGDLW